MEPAYKLYWDFFTITFMFNPILPYSLTHPIEPENLAKLDIDQEMFQEHLKQYLESQDEYLQHLQTKYDSSVETKPLPGIFVTLRTFLDDERNKIQERIIRLPNTVQKAECAVRSYLDASRFSFDENVIYFALSLKKDNIDNELVRKIFVRWKNDFDEHNQNAEKYASPTSFFWFIRTGLEEREIISRYAVKSVLEIGAFDTVFDEIENYAEETLIEYLSSSPMKLIGEEYSYPLVHFLWMLSRDELLSSKLGPLIKIALQRIRRAKTPEIWATYFTSDAHGNTKPIHFPQLNFGAVVCSAFAFARFGTTFEDKATTHALARWLVNHQDISGAWKTNTSNDFQNLFWTVLATNTIILSGLKGVDHVIDIALEWIIAQQTEVGVWDDKEYFFLHFPDTTMTVLNLFKLAERREDYRNLEEDEIKHEPSGRAIELIRKPSENAQVVIEVLFNFGKNLERLPSTYKQKDEEALRDLFVLHMRGFFKDFVGGETFNKKGKTDILVNYEDTNVLVAECKFWTGKKALQDDISQLLGYITWRDRNAALILFVKNKKISNVQNQITETVKSHPNFSNHIKDHDFSWFVYAFHLDEDDEPLIELNIITFHLPPL